MKKTLITVAIYLCFPVFSFIAQADTEKISLRFNADKLTCRIENASLGAILKQFEKEQGVIIKCDPAMEGKKVFAQFDNLSTEVGLRKILRDTNHSLVFDRKGRIRQIIVTGKDKGASPKLANTDPAFKIVKNCLPPDGQAKPVLVTDPAFKIIKNCPPPGGQFEPVAVTDPAFKVIRNAHPPGGQFKSQKGFKP